MSSAPSRHTGPRRGAIAAMFPESVPSREPELRTVSPGRPLKSDCRVFLGSEQVFPYLAPGRSGTVDHRHTECARSCLSKGLGADCRFGDRPLSHHDCVPQAPDREQLAHLVPCNHQHKARDREARGRNRHRELKLPALVPRCRVAGNLPQKAAEKATSATPGGRAGIQNSATEKMNLRA